MGGQGLKAAATLTTDPVLAVDRDVPVFLVTLLIHGGHVDDPLPQPEGNLNALGDPGTGGLPHHDAVHDHLHLVAALAVQRGGGIEREDLAVDPDPLVGIYAAVTRRSESGEPVGALEGVTQHEALKMYTLSGAYAAGWQADTGSIETGKLADLALLDGDPTRVEASEICDVKVRLTVIGGQVVWEG